MFTTPEPPPLEVVEIVIELVECKIVTLLPAINVLYSKPVESLDIPKN